MRTDVSWKRPAARYAALFRDLLARAAPRDRPRPARAARRGAGGRRRERRRLLRPCRGDRILPVRRRGRGGNSPGCACPAAPGRCSTAICRAWRRARATGCARMARGSRPQGHRFNPAKLLLDPFAAAIDRPFRLHPSMFDPPDAGCPRSGRQRRGRCPRASCWPPPEPAPAPPPFDVGPAGDLRAARARLHHAPSRHSAGAARHLRRAGPSGRDRPSATRSASPRSS